jgi:hypothetical protein
MPDQNHQPWYRYRDTLSARAELLLGNQWVLTPSHHAAMISTFLGNMELVKNYAARCYKTLIDSDGFLKDARLETLLKQRPDIAKP